MILIIDSTNQSQVYVALKLGDKIVTEKKAARHFTSQILLQLIDKIVKDRKCGLHDISEIQVKTLGDSATGIRVGLAVANTLGFLLNIPVFEDPH